MTATMACTGHGVAYFAASSDCGSYTRSRTGEPIAAGRIFAKNRSGHIVWSPGSKPRVTAEFQDGCHLAYASSNGVSIDQNASRYALDDRRQGRSQYPRRPSSTAASALPRKTTSPSFRSTNAFLLKIALRFHKNSFQNLTQSPRALMRQLPSRYAA